MTKVGKAGRKAVDEYFYEKGITNILNRIDYTGSLLIKSFDR
jgi:hypothetical protein